MVKYEVGKGMKGHVGKHIKEKQQILCHKNVVSPRCLKTQDTKDFKHSKVEMKKCKNATKKELLT